MVPADALCFFRDGDAWCCVWSDFVDLQESNAGFGSTMDSACLDLRLREPRHWPVEIMERARSSYSSTDLGVRAGLSVFDDED